MIHSLPNAQIRFVRVFFNKIMNKRYIDKHSGDRCTETLSITNQTPGPERTSMIPYLPLRALGVRYFPFVLMREIKS
jgi:hypothetical protein